MRGTTYSERYREVIGGGYIGLDAVDRLAYLIYKNGETERAESVYDALEEYEAMTGRFIDPTFEQFNAIVAALM